jgi:hypothetical protein
MKTLLNAVLMTAGLVLILTLASRAAAPPPQEPAGVSAQVWQVGQCYRVFPENRDQLYIFKVLEPPAGSWIRVQSDPKSPVVPGARPQVPLWLNTNSAFAVQEWSCG